MITRIRPAYLAALTVALGLFLASHAFATVQPNTPAPVANADASAGAVATSNSGSFSTASTGPSNANANNSLQVTQVRQAPGVSPPGLFASNPCVVGASAGLSIAGGSVAGGRVKEDAGCSRREWYRLLRDTAPALALRVACSDPIVAAVAVNGDCDYTKPNPKPDCEACQPKADSYTKEETDQRIEKAFKASQSK
jgi:hypothetical protein